METLTSILVSLVRVLPIIIVLIIGFVQCISNYSKHPKVSRLALGGISVLFIFTALDLFYPFFVGLSFKYFNANSFGYVNFAIGLVMSIFFAAGLGMILYAVWLNRTGK